MASNRSKPPVKHDRRKAPTFEMAVLLCPHQGKAENIANAYGLLVPEYELIRELHVAAFRTMTEAFDGALNDKATVMHFERVVAALVGSAVGAGNFYSDRLLEARTATARAADGGSDEHGTPIGLESKAQRAREFAADIAMQAFALLAAAHGAVDAYKEITGEDWKAYEPPAETGIEKKAAAAQIGAFED